MAKSGTGLLSQRPIAQPLQNNPYLTLCIWRLGHCLEPLKKPSSVSLEPYVMNPQVWHLTATVDNSKRERVNAMRASLPGPGTHVAHPEEVDNYKRERVNTIRASLLGPGTHTMTAALSGRLRSRSRRLHARHSRHSASRSGGSCPSFRWTRRCLLAWLNLGRRRSCGKVNGPKMEDDTAPSSAPCELSLLCGAGGSVLSLLSSGRALKGNKKA